MSHDGTANPEGVAQPGRASTTPVESHPGEAETRAPFPVSEMVSPAGGSGGSNPPPFVTSLFPTTAWSQTSLSPGT